MQRNKAIDCNRYVDNDAALITVSRRHESNQAIRTSLSPSTGPELSDPNRLGAGWGAAAVVTGCALARCCCGCCCCCWPKLFTLPSAVGPSTDRRYPAYTAAEKDHFQRRHTINTFPSSISPPYSPGRFAMYPDGLNPLSTEGLRGLCGGSSGPFISRSTTRRTNLCVSVSN